MQGETSGGVPRSWGRAFKPMVQGSNPCAGTKIEFISGSEQSTTPSAYCQCMSCRRSSGKEPRSR